MAERIDTLLVNRLGALPEGSFGGRSLGLADRQRNLAFRNLTRANMVKLASGQQMAAMVGGPPLKDDDLIVGNGGANLSGLSDQLRNGLLTSTPLWFSMVREAGLNGGAERRG